MPGYFSGRYSVRDINLRKIREENEKLGDIKKLYLWGAGYYSKLVYGTVNKELCIVQGIVDCDNEKQGSIWNDEFSIISPDVLLNVEFDYILITVKAYDEIFKKCLDLGISRDKIVAFWKPDEYMPYVDRRKGIVELERKLEKYKQRLSNLPYELGIGESPDIKSAVALLKDTIKKGLSVCRFGNGELDLMRGKESLWYQQGSEKLSQRLKEVFSSREPDIAIALANNFGNLDCYTEHAADEIRKYLSGNTRKEIMEYVDLSYTYYDAYVSRPYIIYKDKQYSRSIFELLKKLWKDRKLLIVEGIYTRMGAGNNLFSGAGSVRRILCPESNAFDRYDEILKTVCRNVVTDELVLISLGPVATVLAYDLARKGIQAFDIGQIDNEYEWFLRKVDKRVEIAGKSVAEIDECHYPEKTFIDYKYENQIIDEIMS